MKKYKPGEVIYVDDLKEFDESMKKSKAWIHLTYEEEAMTREKFNKFIQEFINEQKELMDIKGSDYSGDKDALSNFKRIAKNIGDDPLKVWYVYASKHWDSITTFVRAGRVNSEHIRGRFLDMANYLLLGMAIIEETCLKNPVDEGFTTTTTNLFDEGENI